MASFTAVDPSTLTNAANLLTKNLITPDTPVEDRILIRNAADYLRGLAKDPERLKEALRPGTVGN